MMYSKFCKDKSFRPGPLDDGDIWEIVKDVIFIMFLVPGSYLICFVFDEILRRGNAILSLLLG